jgi:hypothetical protein
MYVLAPNQTVQKFPYSLKDLRKDNPNVSFPASPSPELLEQWNVYAVLDRDQPQYNYATQNCSMVNPVLENEQWYTNWQITDATPEEIEQRREQKAASVRFERNQRLADCDWTQLADAPVDHSEWATYRQALRDVTAQAGFPWNVEWPSQP